MKLYAFWKHDTFPYLLGGPIAKFCNKDYPGKDWVETENYGKGYYFRPVKIVPLKVGEEFQTKLEALRSEQRIAVEAVCKTYSEKLKKLKSEFGID